jgi:hypothetical protein
MKTVEPANMLNGSDDCDGARLGMKAGVAHNVVLPAPAPPFTPPRRELATITSNEAPHLGEVGGWVLFIRNCPDAPILKNELTPICPIVTLALMQTVANASQVVVVVCTD